MSIARWISTLVLTGAAALPAAAQPLSSLVCPNGGPLFAPFGIVRYQPGMSSVPMLKATLTGPSSRYNDGTQALMYVRTPVADYDSKSLLAPADWRLERWVIQFQGGGECRDAETCYRRWCGTSGVDRAAAMSATGAFGAIPGSLGIWQQDPARNGFAGYNQVWLQYRSSDQWIGSGSHAGLATGDGQTFDIQFNGEAIVNDALERLFDPAGVAPDANDYWQDRLPSLQTAEEIVLVGDSAGGGGLRHHVDRLAAMLRARIPGVRVVAVVDAGNPPGFWTLPPAAWSGTPTAPTGYADLLDTYHRPVVRDFWQADDTALDASCLSAAYAAAHVADGGTHPEVCYDPSYLLFNHITTPFFVRQDIDDPLGKQKYAEWQMFPTEPAYWAAQRAFMAGLSGFAGGHEPVTAPPGLFVPHCREHVSVNSDHFFTRTVQLPAPIVPPSFHGLLMRWMNHVGPFAQIQVDADPGPSFTPSVCPP